MNKLLTLTFIIIAMNTITLQSQSIYQFNCKTIDGKDFSFTSLKGKKILIVNTASECGYTPQYKDLEILYETYKSKNFVIIGLFLALKLV
jgi:glutathione peroxidase